MSMPKTPDELVLMRRSGRLLAQVFAMLDTLAEQGAMEGMSTLAINDLVERHIVDDLASRPASKGQYGFGYVLNSSINQVVCHGVPSADEVLRGGDIVNLDITLEKDGYIADSSKTYMIGTVAPHARRLVQATQAAMWHGIRAVRPGARLGDIGFAIEMMVVKMEEGYDRIRASAYAWSHTASPMLAGTLVTVTRVLAKGCTRAASL